VRRRTAGSRWLGGRLRDGLAAGLIAVHEFRVKDLVGGRQVVLILAAEGVSRRRVNGSRGTASSVPTVDLTDPPL
jgi:hypothetical protein